MRTIAASITVSVLLALHGLASAFYDGTDVKILTPNIFDDTLSKQDGVYAVEFYAPWCGHCKNLTPEWKKAAKALRGIVGVAAVDADAHRELGSRFGVQGFPTIKFFHSSKAGKLVASDYNGGRTAADIIKGALAEASKVALGRIGAKASSGGGGRASGGAGGQAGCGAGGGGGGGGGEDLYGANTDIVKLTDADFHKKVTSGDDLWMVEFFAPWCGHCKALAPEYDKFATAVKGKVKVGAVDCTQHEATCSEFGVRGYPTIKWFSTADKDSPADYDGGRDESSLTAYALEKWQQQLPPPEVRQLTDQEGFVENCLGAAADEDLDLAAVPARQLCFLLFAPNILDSQAAGRNKYLDVLKQLAETHKTRPFSYLWVEAGAQPELEAAVGVGGYGYPALVALSPSKLKYAALRSAYETDAVKTFVNHVRQGTERVQPVHGDALPILRSTDAWDGKDGKPPEEDEFDLADLMSEEL